MTNKEALKILKSWDGYMFLEREEGCVGYSYLREVSQEAIDTAIKALENRPQGKWIKSKDGYFRCDKCGSRGSAIKARFCHHCGADMRGKKNETDN